MLKNRGSAGSQLAPFWPHEQTAAQRQHTERESACIDPAKHRRNKTWDNQNNRQSPYLSCRRRCKGKRKERHDQPHPRSNSLRGDRRGSRLFLTLFLGLFRTQLLLQAGPLLLGAPRGGRRRARDSGGWSSGGCRWLLLQMRQSAGAGRHAYHLAWGRAVWRAEIFVHPRTKQQPKDRRCDQCREESSKR